MSLPFKINITVSYGLNIRLSNQAPHFEKMHHHFTDVEHAAFFANTLEHTLQTAPYTDRNRCFICGKAISKGDALYGLEGGEYAHPRCFFNRFYRGSGENQPPYICVSAEPSFDKKAKDFSNLDSRLGYGKFAFSIEAVSKKSIHLCIRDGNNARKNNFYFSYDQCMALISEIRQKLDALENSITGQCCYCEKTIRVDQDSFRLCDDTMLHRCCLENFISSSKASSAHFPAVPVRGRDVFGLAQYRR